MPERAFTFTSAAAELLAISHSPNHPSLNTAILIVVGGPQTRVGSHRQFVLLARYLAEQGVPCMRFDYTGMGDSEGDFADFLNVSDDIQAAVAECKQAFGVERVVLWGLCDAASAALIYAKHCPTDSVPAMILLNPWVRSEQGEAKTIVKHYYLNRLKDKAFWRKVFTLNFDLSRSFRDLGENLSKMRTSASEVSSQQTEKTTEDNYIQHMADGLSQYSGDVKLIISGDDLTATEFLELVKSRDDWKQLVATKVSEQHRLPNANHTFSSAAWRGEVEQKTLQWVKEIDTSSQ